MGAKKGRNDTGKSQARKRSRIRSESGGRQIYAAAIMGVAALLVCAFFLPQILFQASDNELCNDTVLGQRESVDVLLDATYELSLYNRMLSFAEGFEEGINYYVSVQDLGVDEELYEQLNGSVGRLLQDPMIILMESRLVPITLAEYFTVEQRRQYVIYSDDYTRGVNFIIWYLELAGYNGEKLELLMDARTYTIYGIKAARSSPMTEEEAYSYKNGWQSYLWTTGLAIHLQAAGMFSIINSQEDVRELGLNLGLYYDCISASELDTYYEISRITDRFNAAELGYDKFDYETLAIKQRLETLSEGEWLDENNLIFHLPYGEYSMRLRLSMELEEPAPTHRYHDTFLGFDAICQLIPEFVEEN